MSDNLFERIAERARANPGRAALETPAGNVLDYGRMLTLSTRFAHVLRHCGAAPGERIAVQVAKTPQTLCLYLACLRAGFIYLPLNTAYTRSELGYFFGNAKPRVVVCGPESLPEMRALAQEIGLDCRILTLDPAGRGTLLDGADTMAGEYPAEGCTADTVAAIVYTSGTTGRPKGVMLTHGNLASNASTLTEIWGFTDADVLLHALPIFHVHGLFVACHCALLSGAKMNFLPKFKVAELLRALPRSTVMMGVPTFYTRLLAEPAFDRETCRNMRLFISGSAPLPEETFRAFRDRTGHAVLERYGMTETGMNTSNPLDGERIAGTVGMPLPGVAVRVVDANGAPVPEGGVGTIEVSGPNVTPGYWQQPDKTAEDFTGDGYLRTGDLGSFDRRGYLRIVGRAKDLVITGGYNVYPKEVERVLDDIEGVFESAVFGVAHPDFGEAVTAVVVPHAGAAPDVARILEQARRELAAYKVPKQVMLIDALPRNTMGKVQKNLLRERFAELYRTA